MQTIGYVQVSGEIILVLIRSTKYGRSLKVRQSGTQGAYLHDESDYLNEFPDLLERLKSGATIAL